MKIKFQSFLSLNFERLEKCYLQNRLFVCVRERERKIDYFKMREREKVEKLTFERQRLKKEFILFLKGFGDEEPVV